MKEEQIKARLFEMMNRVNKITLKEEVLHGGLGDNKSTSEFDEIMNFDMDFYNEN